MSFLRPANAIFVPGMYCVSRVKSTSTLRGQSVCTHLLGVLEVLEEGVLLPLNTLVLVGVGVRETGDLARLAAEETVELRANLVALAGLQGVALCATSLEEVGTLLGVT